MQLTEEAVLRAITVLGACESKYGLYASGVKGGYTQIWSRDSNITMIGASTHTKMFEKVFAKSLETLAAKQSKLGQIPNAVDFVGSIDKPATFATIDSSLWFVLGEYFYKKRFGNALWKKHSENIEKAMKWIAYQDAGEDLLPEQLPTSDWQDCFPHKYGHTINTQALYYGTLKAAGKTKELAKYKKAVDYYLWNKKLGYYLPWHWKDHGNYSEKEKWFDSLGNVLAIVFGLADKKQAKSILKFIESKKIDEPFPVKAIYPPIKKNSPEWKDYFDACLASEPNSYLNAGIWPFIGGFYVCALEEAGFHQKAAKCLEKLAEANKLGVKGNLNWDFNEWINPTTKKAEGGRFQAWSAGGYLLAYEAVKQKKNILKI